METLNTSYVEYKPTKINDSADISDFEVPKFTLKLNSFDNLQNPEPEKKKDSPLNWFDSYAAKLSLGLASSLSPTSSYITQYFVNKGLTREQAKGIYGNLMQESGGRLNAVSGDGHNSYGIAQWTGSRKKALFDWCGTKNPNLNQQLDFLWHELETTESGALADLKKQKTINSATESFMRKFERPANWAANLKQRIKYANG